MYYKGKMVHSRRKDPLFGHVDGFQIDLRHFENFFERNRRLATRRGMCYNTEKQLPGGILWEKTGQFAEKQTAAVQSAGFEKFKTVMSKVNSVINLIGVWLFRLRKFIMAAPVVYAAIRLASYNGQHLPEQVGLDLQSTGEFAMTVKPSAGGDGTAGADGGVSAADVLLKKGHVPVGDQHFHPCVAGAAAGEQRISELRPLKKFFCVCSKVSSPIAAGVWYTVGTEAETVGKADAVEISADKPTAYP